MKGTDPQRCWALSNSVGFWGSLEVLGLTRIRFGRWFEVFNSEKWGWKPPMCELLEIFFLCWFLLTSTKSWLGYLYVKKPAEIESLGFGNMGTRRWLWWVDRGWMSGALQNCSVSSFGWTGEKEKIIKGSWVEKRTGRDQSPVTLKGQTGWTWGN